jgi:hypothetical protein
MSLDSIAQSMAYLQENPPTPEEVNAVYESLALRYTSLEAVGNELLAAVQGGDYSRIQEFNVNAQARAEARRQMEELNAYRLKLTPRERAIARAAGMTDEQYAKVRDGR